MATELPTVSEPQRAERCETCKWWERGSPMRSKNGDLISSSFGKCHRYPPTQCVFDAVKMAINARDAFLKLDKRDYDYQCTTPYTDSLKQAEKSDDLDAVPDGNEFIYWPPTAQEDFCGEWRAK